jgi:hypothetical protein
MELCAFCQAEDTLLFENGAPICLKCRDAPPGARRARITLFRDLNEATKQAKAAKDALTATTLNVPSGITHLDGLNRILNASREMTAAWDKMASAYERLTDYLERGIVPEDLKA